MKRAESLHVGTGPLERDALTNNINDLGSIFYTLNRVFLFE
jgi:hypothetical protein